LFNRFLNWYFQISLVKVAAAALRLKLLLKLELLLSSGQNRSVFKLILLPSDQNRNRFQINTAAFKSKQQLFLR
jgi:hypothetical protein